VVVGCWLVGGTGLFVLRFGGGVLGFGGGLC